MGRSKLLLLSLLSGTLLSIPWMAHAGSWLLLMAWIPLLMVEDQLHRQGRAGVSFFFYALIACLTWNILSTWWISYVSLAGMLTIALINAVLMSAIWWMAQSIKRTLGSRTAYFSLIVFWLSFEYLHFHWSMQWPWLTLGNGFAFMPEGVQWYEYTGVLGGSLWILLVNMVLYSTIKFLKENPWQQSLKPITGLLLLVFFPLGWSVYRYHTYKESKHQVQVAVLQPNIDPYKDKFAGMSYEAQARRLIALAQSIVHDSTHYVLAPETALEPLWESDSLKDQPSLRLFDTLFVNHPRLTVMAGAITQRKIKEEDAPSHAVRRLDNGERYEVYNSVLHIDPSPEVKIGHKSILVSGVEKMPFQEYFSFLSNYLVNAGGTSGTLAAAAQPTVFKGDQGANVGSVICFESAFGAFVAGSVKNGANVIFVITNDGWWKESAGLDQHFAYSRLRAVETRRSIARSANTGLSGFISERGEVIKMTASNTTTALSASLTCNNELTFYVRHGDYLGWISAIMAVMIGLYGMGKKREIYN